jgi:hypothetical protein
VFEFLREHFKSHEAFTKRELEQVTTWRGQSFNTYWSKQFSPFMVPARDGKFRVSEAFRPYATWEKFQQHVTQVRHVSSDYKRVAYDHLLTYEFYMPLTNEAHLRITLDALFYKDTILARLRTHSRAELESHVPKEPGESDNAYLERTCARMSEFFQGYSISHVSGRFRVEKLATIDQAAKIQSDGGRYLIDETTAVVRFIFPCKDTDEAKMVEWFFQTLFIESIIQVVNGEDQIWMVESGMVTRLHIWKVENSDRDPGR